MSTFNDYNNTLLNNWRTGNEQLFAKLTPADIQFYETISDRVTSSNALPFDIPAKTVFRLIVKGMKFFWEWYEQATEERTLYLPYSEIIKSPGSKLNRQVKLPNGIEALYGWDIVGGQSYGDNISQYINYALLQNLNTGASWSTDTGATRGAYQSNNTSIVNVVTALYEVEQWKQIFDRTIRASYNKHSQIFSIQSEVTSSMVLHCFVRLQPEYMYNIQLFEDYVVALVNEQLGSIIGLFDFKYPGGVQPDFDKIKDAGKEEKDKIEEFLKEANTGAMISGK